MKDSDYYVGFSVSYPLGDSQGESDARAAELAVKDPSAFTLIAEKAAAALKTAK